MNKLQKSVFSGLTAIAMLLGAQAAFADSIMNTNQSGAQDVQELNAIFKPLWTISGTVGDPTTPIFLSTTKPVKVSVNAPNGGNFVVYAISESGSYYDLGEIIGSNSLTAQIWGGPGYYRIYVSSSFTGTFTVTY
ncbi:hypothetical protein [Paenibacillus sp. FSL H3-0333]|uniref:hypothetical protein n=1 Tax=Paenibacillus sp. FSL H3-0333 TaxID=2921373 RepID=UPI0030F7EF90